MITQVGDEHDERDGGAERPVQLMQVFVVDEVAAIFSRRPPSRPGIAKALAERPNTIRLPDSMPGITCGSTTRRSVVKRDAPSDQAAASTHGSSFCSEVHTGITMKGSITCTSAMTMAVSV